MNTNEIRGNGIYLLHPEIKLLSIGALNSIELRFEEERFVKLDNPNFEVYYSHHTSYVNISIIMYKYILFLE